MCVSRWESCDCIVIPFTESEPPETFSLEGEKKKDSRMIFNVVGTPDTEEGGFTVSCPALPGCHSQGETIEEALDNIRDAISGCIEVLNRRALDR